MKSKRFNMFFLLVILGISHPSWANDLWNESQKKREYNWCINDIETLNSTKECRCAVNEYSRSMTYSEWTRGGKDLAAGRYNTALGNIIIDIDEFCRLPYLFK